MTLNVKTDGSETVMSASPVKLAEPNATPVRIVPLSTTLLVEIEIVGGVPFVLVTVEPKRIKYVPVVRLTAFSPAEVISVWFVG